MVIIAHLVGRINVRDRNNSRLVPITILQKSHKVMHRANLTVITAILFI